MLKILTCLFLFSTFFLGNFSHAAVITKIGYVDFQRIFTEVDFSSIISSQNANLSGQTDQVNNSLNQLTSMILNYEINKPNLSLRETLSNYQTLNLKINDFSRMTGEIYIPPEQDILINSKIMTMITKAVEEVGTFLGYSVIIEKTNLIYGHQIVNITEYVIRSLNDKLSNLK